MAVNDTTMIIESVQQYWPSFPITQQQLEHPTSEFVIEFYEMFRESMQNILHRMTNREEEEANHPRATNESIFSLLAFINKYLKNSVPHPEIDCVLTLTDLYEPTAKRTKIRCKILLSLLSFYENQIEIFRATMQKRLYQAQEQVAKSHEKENFKVALAKEAEHLANMEDNINQLQKELQKSKTRYDNLQLQKMDNDRKHTKLQLDADGLSKAYDNKEMLLTNIKSTIQRFEEQVVVDDHYRSMLNLKENLVKKCGDLDDEMTTLGKSLDDKIPTVERFGNIEKHYQKLAGYEELMSPQICDSQEKNNELKIEHQNYQKKLDKIRNIEQQKIEYKKSVAKIEAAGQAATLRYNKDMANFKKQTEELQSRLNEEKTLQVKLINEKELLTSKNENLKKECEDITESIQELNVLYANTYERMFKAESDSTNNLKENLNNISEAFGKEF